MMQVLNYAFKGYQIYSAGSDAAQIRNDPNATSTDKIIAALHAAFAGMQMGDIVVRNLSILPASLKLGTSFLTGCLNIGQTAGKTYHCINKLKKEKKWNNLQAIKIAAGGSGILFFRVSDITNVARGISDSASVMESCDQICQFSNMLGNIGMGTATVIAISSKIEIIKEVWVQYRRCRTLNSARNEALIPLRSGTPAAAREALRFKNERGDSNDTSNVILSDPVKAKQEIEELLQYQASMDNLNEIPDLIADDERLRLYRCPIAKWPIRFAVKPNIGIENNNFDNNLAYERREIEKWLLERPNEAPPRWPVELLPLPLKREYFVTDRSLQTTINKILEEIIKEIQRYCLEAARESKKFEN